MSLPEEALQALGRSFLKDESLETWTDLLDGGSIVDVPEASEWPPDQEPQMALVIEGLFRMTYLDNTGKMVTVRYIGPSGFMGIPGMVAGSVPISTSSLTSGRLYLANIGKFQRVARSSALLSWMVAEFICERLYHTLSDLIYVQCRSIRDRLALHLREMALQLGRATNIHLPISQQVLADGIGTSREVVARALREMRDEGWLETGREGIMIADIHRLPVGELPISARYPEPGSQKS